MQHGNVSQVFRVAALMALVMLVVGASRVDGRRQSAPRFWDRQGQHRRELAGCDR